jgi:hypothetical protein
MSLKSEKLRCNASGEKRKCDSIDVSLGFQKRIPTGHDEG